MPCKVLVQPTTPFQIAVDTREQVPYLFKEIKCDKRLGKGMMQVPVVTSTLRSGDYSIVGFTDKVAIERKGIDDLCGTLTSGRMRFVRELERLNEMEVAWVVTEVSFDQLVSGFEAHSKVNLKTLWRSAMAFQVRFPRVHWWGCPGRQAAQVVTYRLLEKWWMEHVGKPEIALRRARVKK